MVRSFYTWWDSFIIQASQDPLIHLNVLHSASTSRGLPHLCKWHMMITCLSEVWQFSPPCFSKNTTSSRSQHRDIRLNSGEEKNSVPGPSSPWVHHLIKNIFILYLLHYVLGLLSPPWGGISSATKPRLYSSDKLSKTFTTHTNHRITVAKMRASQVQLCSK